MDGRPKVLTLEKPPPAEALLALVEKLRAESPSSRLGVGGTWSSPKQDAVPLELWPVTDAILAALPGGRWDVTWWANVLKPGDALGRHDHRHSHKGGANAFAAVYYAQVDGGRILFDPRKVDGDKADVPVEAGLLLVFPADLEHSVPPWEGKADGGERVSFAFNVRALE